MSGGRETQGRETTTTRIKTPERKKVTGATGAILRSGLHENGREKSHL